MNTELLERVSPFLTTGRVAAVAGLEITVTGLHVAVGAMVTIGYSGE